MMMVKKMMGWEMEETSYLNHVSKLLRERVSREGQCLGTKSFLEGLKSFASEHKCFSSEQKFLGGTQMSCKVSQGTRKNLASECQ